MPISVNPMKASLAAGQVQVGTWLNLVRNPAILTLLKSAGLDYARLDMEHSSPSIETVADFAVLARALNFPLVVRPPEGSREHRRRLIDAANKHGKDVAMLVPTLDEAERWIKAGVKIIAFSSDTAVLRDAYRAAATRLRR